MVCPGVVRVVRGRRRRDPAIGKDRSAAAEDRSVPVGAGVDADLVALLMGESPGFQMVRAAYGRHRVDGLRSAWRPWALAMRLSCHEDNSWRLAVATGCPMS